MAEPNDPAGLPGGEEDGSELERALKKAARQPRQDPDSNEIAADDAGGSTVAEDREPPKP